MADLAELPAPRIRSLNGMLAGKISRRYRRDDLKSQADVYEKRAGGRGVKEQNGYCEITLTSRKEREREKKRSRRE